jgi:hypothetical protein
MNLSNINVDQIAGKINEIDPFAMLEQLGYGKKEAQVILDGDMTPILEKTAQKQEISFGVLMDNYGNMFNQNLLRYFFKKAKELKGFTEEEMRAYNEAYTIWFDFVFKVGKNFIYQVDEELQDLSLIIEVENCYYQMSKIGEINSIIYIPDYKASP